MDIIAQWINQYGFPIVATVGLAYVIYYIYRWATLEIKPKLTQAQEILILLVDRVRMLDNDMIILQTKINMVLEFKEEYEKMTGRKLDIDVDDIIEEQKKINRKRVQKK